MSWNRIDVTSPPVGRPLLVRTLEHAEPLIAFLGPDGVWYEGGALVQSASTMLSAIPTDWCEPTGEATL